MKSFALLLSLVWSVAFGESSCESSVCEAADSVNTDTLLQTARTQSEQDENEKTEEVDMIGENASLQGDKCEDPKKCDDTRKCNNKACRNCEKGSRCTKQLSLGNELSGKGTCVCADSATICLPQEDYHNRGYCRGFSACFDKENNEIVKCKNCPQGAVREGWKKEDSYAYHCADSWVYIGHRCLCCEGGAMNFPTDGNWGCKEA